MSSGRQCSAAGKAHPSGPSSQPPRILVIDIYAPSWTHICCRLCEALENIFSLACSLVGPPRIPLLSLYVTWKQQECLLPFTPVRGNFARLQGCLAELRALPVEGAFRPVEHLVAQAVQDGLQQFKQYTRQGMAGATLSSSSVEFGEIVLEFITIPSVFTIRKSLMSSGNMAFFVADASFLHLLPPPRDALKAREAICYLPNLQKITILTGQSGTELVRQLEAKLQGTDLVSLRQLQVIEISKDGFQGPSDAESASHIGEGAGRSTGEHSLVLGTDVDLQVVANDVVALEMFFKGWFHDHSADQEHLHLLLPARAVGPRASLMCLKCDIQERLLAPALLPTAYGEDTRGPFWMAADGGPIVPRLRVIRALKARGLCQSVLFGLPLIIRPTNCWQLSWEELEANQHHFQALCHCLRAGHLTWSVATALPTPLHQDFIRLWSSKDQALLGCSSEGSWSGSPEQLQDFGFLLQRREWLLLAELELQGAGASGGLLASSFQVLIPSDSSTLLLRSMAVQELVLPCSLPPLPTEPPKVAVNSMENLLDSLEVEPAYNPLSVTSHLYRTLSSSLGQAPGTRPPHPPRQSKRQPSSKARATVAPLHLAPPAVPPLFSSEEEELTEL